MGQGSGNPTCLVCDAPCVNGSRTGLPLRWPALTSKSRDYTCRPRGTVPGVRAYLLIMDVGSGEGLRSTALRALAGLGAGEGLRSRVDALATTATIAAPTSSTINLQHRGQASESEV